MHNKNSNIQGRSFCDKTDFPDYKELLIKERIRSIWEQILSFKIISHLKSDAIEKSLLDPVVSL